MELHAGYSVMLDEVLAGANMIGENDAWPEGWRWCYLPEN